MIEPRLLKLIENLLSVLFILSLFFSVSVLVYMGIMYLTKSEEGAKQVHKMMPLFIIGLVLIFLSLTIPKIIRFFFE